MDAVDKKELKGLLEEGLRFERNRFEYLTLSYKISLLGLTGVDTKEAKQVLKGLTINSSISINEQFTSKVSDECFTNLVETDKSKLIRYAYMATSLTVKQELMKLRGLVNGRKLLELTNELNSFFIEGVNEIQNIEKKVESKLKYFFQFIDELYETKLVA